MGCPDVMETLEHPESIVMVSPVRMESLVVMVTPEDPDSVDDLVIEEHEELLELMETLELLVPPVRMHLTGHPENSEHPAETVYPAEMVPPDDLVSVVTLDLVEHPVTLVLPDPPELVDSMVNLVSVGQETLEHGVIPVSPEIKVNLGLMESLEEMETMEGMGILDVEEALVTVECLVIPVRTEPPVPPERGELPTSVPEPPEGPDRAELDILEDLELGVITVPPVPPENLVPPETGRSLGLDPQVEMACPDDLDPGVIPAWMDLPDPLDPRVWMGSAGMVLMDDPALPDIGVTLEGTDNPVLGEKGELMVLQVHLQSA